MSRKFSGKDRACNLQNWRVFRPNIKPFLCRSQPLIIPFRESKLTRLFQGFFCGKGRASMVVNVNMCASMFDETFHVMKFSAIAKKVKNMSYCSFYSQE